MEITLKNIKVAKFMSQETLCYSATVYVDGKKAGHSENDGHGGCSSVHLNPEFNHLYHMKFNVPCGCDHNPNCPLCKGTDKYSVGIYDYCDHLAHELDKAKERNAFTKKLLKNGMNYMIVAHGQYIGIKATDEAQVRAYMAKKYPKQHIHEIIKVG